MTYRDVDRGARHKKYHSLQVACANNVGRRHLGVMSLLEWNEACAIKTGTRACKKPCAKTRNRDAPRHRCFILWGYVKRFPAFVSVVQCGSSEVFLSVLSGRIWESNLGSLVLLAEGKVSIFNIECVKLYDRCV